MKILTTKDSAIVAGDIQSNSVSIDVKNIDFITHLLSSNLYSKPIDSFIREITSNAWDSHVEAGNEEPILLELGTDTEGRHFCRIQDFGVGLSPQRFSDVFMNIGSSTKREDNEQIGGFGIGRFASLAYSDTVYLTSNYEGMKYKYLMYKDGSKIKIDELHVTTTDEKNGLEVLVYLKDNNHIFSFRDAIKSQLLYFENLYLTTDRFNDDNSYTYDTIRQFNHDFNNLKIKRYNNFSVNTLNSNSAKPTVLLGKVQYPIQLSLFTQHDNSLTLNKEYPIAINFEIGELEVTPNREQLLYSTHNIEVINNKLKKVQEEIDEIITSQNITDYTDKYDYINTLRAGYFKVKLYEDNDNEISFQQKIHYKDITLNGISYNEEVLKLHEVIISTDVFKRITHYSSSGRIITANAKSSAPSLTLEDFRRMPITTIESIFIMDDKGFNATTKDYIREEMEETIYIKPFDKAKLIKEFIIRAKEHSKAYKINNWRTEKVKWNWRYAKLLIRELIEYLDKIETFSNEDVPEEYIERRKEELKLARESSQSNVKKNSTIAIYEVREADRHVWGSIPVTTDSIPHTMEQLKNNYKNRLVIYDVKDSNRLRELFYLFHLTSNENRYKFIEVAPTRIKVLETLPNFMHIDNFMNEKHLAIRKLGTAMHIYDNYFYIEQMYYKTNHIINNISNTLGDIIKKVMSYINAYYHRNSWNDNLKNIKNEIIEICEKNNYYDLEMLGLIKENEKLLENAKYLTIITNESPSLYKETINLAVDYALSRKLFRPNLEAVKKLRKETILNIKEENENN